MKKDNLKIELVYGELFENKKLLVIVSNRIDGVSTYVDTSIFKDIKDKDLFEFFYNLEESISECIKSIKE
jgi:hypothetical protein